MSEEMGHEPDDGTNFGSHAFPAFNSHFGQTKFLAIYPASCNVNEVVFWRRRRSRAASNERRNGTKTLKPGVWPICKKRAAGQTGSAAPVHQSFDFSITN
ncbi:MAG: hypothetical protein J6X19_02810 [Clostridia bacterium]|nr:hypothetical protein [Clostridia bacterium]